MMINKAETAKTLGTKAFENGLGQVPASDKDLAPLFKGCQVGDGQATAICNGWLDGWHEACDAKLATL